MPHNAIVQIGLFLKNWNEYRLCAWGKITTNARVLE